jgi:hypothetical protein
VDFNPQKPKCMLFSTNQGNIKPQILFNNEDVEFVVNHKHLGATFSEFNLCSISFILEDKYDSDVSSANNRERL